MLHSSRDGNGCGEVSGAPGEEGRGAGGHLANIWKVVGAGRGGAGQKGRCVGRVTAASIVQGKVWRS